MSGPRTKYEGSWPEAFNQKGISVFTMDHQGHGRSQYARGLRCYFDRVDYLVDDFTQFTKLVRQELGAETPLFIAGMSMVRLVQEVLQADPGLKAPGFKF